ncbi:MAG: SH3 domain-containing protein [Defluviitaleaceae bacterium]|nr:SH3 domain-containing protein [Defluviitaleaceae bacterium]
MQVKVLQNHPGEGQFPTFPAGTPVTITGDECAEFLHWYPCEIDGHATYVPDTFLHNGALNRTYNPTELVQKAGDILTVNAIINAWLLATNATGQTGWIPAEICITP